MKYKSVIFDLDGTLLNTIADLGNAVNQALVRMGFPTWTMEEYRWKVGNGVMKLFERSLPDDKRTPIYINKVKELFTPYYETHGRDETRPYDGIPELLSSLTAHGVRVAVASNKYDAAVRKLIPHYFPEVGWSAVCGNREGVPVKPDPAIVNTIMEEGGMQRADTLYVGDSNVDMQTAHNAGLAACGVTWGFRPRAELEAEHPEYVVDRPKDILEIVLGRE